MRARISRRVRRRITRSSRSRPGPGGGDAGGLPRQARAGGRYVGVLPAPSATTPSIEYVILAQSADGQVVRTDPYTVQVRRTGDTPAWQTTSADGQVKVFSEIPNAPQTVAGFTDSLA